ncbi:MAG: cyclic nucleotide-binding domain-containing protein [Myxococcales bacterium]|nr:cyclic nucleotide-binding domain-containing protein [Myxococcales bacterium]
MLGLDLHPNSAAGDGSRWWILANCALRRADASRYLAGRTAREMKPMADARVLPVLHLIKPLGSLPEADLQVLADLLQPKFLRAGEVLYRQGDRGTSMAILADGILRLQWQDPRGEVAPLGSLKRGDFAGEMALLDPAPRSATVLAASECLCFELTDTDLVLLMCRSPAATSRLVSAITHALTKRIRAANEQLESIVRASAQGGRAPSQPIRLPDDAIGARPDSVMSRLWAKITGG